MRPRFPRNRAAVQGLATRSPFPPGSVRDSGLGSRSQGWFGGKDLRSLLPSGVSFSAVAGGRPWDIPDLCPGTNSATLQVREVVIQWGS